MDTLEKLIDDCQKSGMFNTVDYNKFNELLMIHSSSVMEGSTLTLHETEMLIVENLTPEGKPLEHSLMVKDHYNALMVVNDFAKSEKLSFSHNLIKEVSKSVMRSTGDKVNTSLGTYDKSEGDYRLNNVRSSGGHYYLNYDKIKARMDLLISNINESLSTAKSANEIFTLASSAHLEFLTIHPLGDGNGRTARLINNLILLHKKLPLLILTDNKKGKYIEAIKASREAETGVIFNTFLKQEYMSYWQNELTRYLKNIGKASEF